MSQNLTPQEKRALRLFGYSVFSGGCLLASLALAVISAVGACALAALYFLFTGEFLLG